MGGGEAIYEWIEPSRHHHLVCRGCGAIVDVACAVGEAPCLDASEHHGFDIDEAEVVYWGTCPACTTA